MTPDTISAGIDAVPENRVIRISVTPVSRVAVAGPIAIAVGRSVGVRGVAVTGPITVAISRGVSVTIAVSGVAVAIAVIRITVAVSIG